MMALPLLLSSLARSGGSSSCWRSCVAGRQLDGVSLLRWALQQQQQQQVLLVHDHAGSIATTAAAWQQPLGHRQQHSFAAAGSSTSSSSSRRRAIPHRRRGGEGGHQSSSLPAAAPAARARDDHRSPPRLPSSIGWLQQPQQQQHHVLQQPGGAAALAAPLPVAEGDLHALIVAARSLADVEELVLQHHTQFRHHHLAAAVAKLPRLSMGSSVNMQQRCTRLTRLLASGLLNVSGRLDAHQLAGCLAALSSPRCIRPLQAGPVQRLLLLLVQHDGAALQQLHSYELADVAAAAAALQEAVRHQHPQQQQEQKQQQQQQQQEQQEQEQALLLVDAAAQQQSTPPDSLAALDGLTPPGGSSSSALALRDPLERLWQHLHDACLPRLATFSADSLALTALSFAAAGTASERLLLSISHAALARPHKFADAPLAACRMLQALALAGSTAGQALPMMLGAALAAPGAAGALSSKQAVATVAALARLHLYHEPALLALCKAATRSLKHWHGSQVASLLASLASLRFHDAPLLAAAAKVVQAGAAGGQLSCEEMADSLAALLQLGFSSQRLEGLLMALRSRLRADAGATHDGARLAPGTAARLVWALAVLEAGDELLLEQLLGHLHGVPARQLAQAELRMLYQAHRLSTHSWLQQPAAEHPAHDDAGSAEQAWPPALLAAGQAAAGAHAAASARRARQQAMQVAEGFEDLGLPAPVTGLTLDGGALRPDLALTAPLPGPGRRAPRGQQQLQVALMCDHADRLCRNAPHQLLGYWRVAGWLLEAAGWRVVRVPAHEWAALTAAGGDGGGGGGGGSNMAHVYNLLAAAGLPPL